MTDINNDLVPEIRDCTEAERKKALHVICVGTDHPKALRDIAAGGGANERNAELSDQCGQLPATTPDWLSESTDAMLRKKLLTCDGCGKRYKEAVLNELLRRIQLGANTMKEYMETA